MNKKNILIAAGGIILIFIIIASIVFVTQNNKAQRNQALEKQRLLEEEAKKNVFTPDVFGAEANDVLVSLEVNVPEWTPTEDKIYLVIDDYQTPIDGRLSRGLPMKQRTDNVWVVGYRAQSGEKLRYKFNRNNSGYDTDEEFFPDTEDAWRVVEAGSEDMVIKSAVKKWRWLADEKLDSVASAFQPDYIPKRSSPLITGAFMLDFYHPKFKPFIPATFDRLKEKGFQYVQLADFPAFITAAEPLTIMAGSKESFGFVDYAIQEARQRDLKIILAARLEAQWDNHEQINNALRATHSNAWHANYVETWKKSMLKSAAAAEKNKVEILVLPNPWPLFQYESAAQKDFVNALVHEAYAALRPVYTGKISSDLFAEDAHFDFYGKLDWIGDTWRFPLSERKETDLEYMTKQAQEIIEQRYQPVFKKYNRPIFLQQVGYAAFDGAAGAEQLSTESLAIADWMPLNEKYPTDFAEQADAHEAFFRAIFDEPIFAGAVAEDYPYWNTRDKLWGIRNKPAEDIWVKWSKILK